MVSERLTQICAGGLIETLFVGVSQLQKSIAGFRKMACSSVALLLVGDEKQVRMNGAVGGREIETGRVSV